jgi:predicted phage-related endonuclease
MERGLELEPLVIRLYERSVDRKILPGPWVVSKDFAFMAATPDAIDDGINSAVQCKTSSVWGRHKFGDAGTPMVPIDYYIQAQHEMAVMGAKRNQLVVLFADNDMFRALQHMLRAGMELDKVAEFVEGQHAREHSLTEFAVFPIERDDETIALLIEGERHFWTEHVEKQTPPADLLAPEKTSDVIEADADARKLLLAMKAAHDATKVAKQSYDEAKALVATAIGDNAGIFDPDIGKVTNKAGPERPKLVIEDALAELRKDHAEAFADAEQASRVIVDESMLLAKLKTRFPDDYKAVIAKHTITTRTGRSIRPYWKKVRAGKK